MHSYSVITGKTDKRFRKKKSGRPSRFSILFRKLLPLIDYVVDTSSETGCFTRSMNA